MSFQTTALREQREQLEKRVRSGEDELFDPLSAQLISLVAVGPEHLEDTDQDNEEAKEAQRQRQERYAKFGRPTDNYVWTYFPHNNQWVAFTRESADSILKVKDIAQAQLNRKRRTARFNVCDLPTWVIRCHE